MNVKDFARMKMCSVMIPDVCNHNPATTVLAHIRRAHVAGTSQKPPNLCAVHACYACHNFIDNRDLSNQRKRQHEAMISCGDLDTAILEAMCRTLRRVENAILAGVVTL